MCLVSQQAVCARIELVGADELNVQLLETLGLACGACELSFADPALRIAVILDVYPVLDREVVGKLACELHVDALESLGLAGSACSAACLDPVHPADILDMDLVLDGTFVSRVILEIDRNAL